MEYLIDIFSQPSVWVALFTLVVMEVVLGIDNLIFISILTNKLPPEQREKARRIGIGLALVMRLGLLGTISFIMRLTEPVFTAFGQAFSWKDLILISGGLFLVWKATKEIHQFVDPEPEHVGTTAATLTFGAAISQILLLDMVFSIDSIITAVGMTDYVIVMVIAVVAAVTAMLVAANPLANFVHRNPSVLMLALGFLLLIGTTLVAEGFGFHLPKGYIYAAMGFAAGVEVLNLLGRRAKGPKPPVH